jgi:hypothetical protein
MNFRKGNGLYSGKVPPEHDAAEERCEAEDEHDRDHRVANAGQCSMTLAFVSPPRTTLKMASSAGEEWPVFHHNTVTVVFERRQDVL